MELVRLDTEWWADADGNPVPFDSPEGKTVLYGVGALVPLAVAESLKSLSEPPKDKAIRRAPKTK